MSDTLYERLSQGYDCTHWHVISEFVVVKISLQSHRYGFVCEHSHNMVRALAEVSISEKGVVFWRKVLGHGCWQS